MDVSKINWHAKSSEEALDDVLAGDIIIFKGENGWLYHFKCECIEIDEKGVRARITSVFDWDTKSPILAGDVTTLAGEVITLPIECIFEVDRKVGKP